MRFYIILCGVFLISESVLANDYQYLIGKSDVRNLEGVKEHTGILVSDESNIIGVTILNHKGNIILALEVDDIVVAVYEAPPENNGTLYTGGLCWVDGERRPDIIFLVKVGERNQDFTDIIKAWKVDAKSKIFSEIQVTKARCVNDVYVD